MNFGNDIVATDMTFENVPSGMKVLSGTVQTLSGDAQTGLYYRDEMFENV